MVDFVELDMIDFDVILVMDCLYTCLASIDCITRVVKFQFPDEPILEQKGKNLALKSQIISCLQSSKMIAKSCCGSQDLESEAPSLEFIPVLKDFPEVFPDDLPGVPPE